MIARELREALTELLDDRIRFDAPMARCVSLGVGGPTDALATPCDRIELAAILQLCARHGVRHHVLGSGFNTLVSEARVPGVVIQLSKLRGIGERPGGLLRVEAGISHSHITRFCVDGGFSGLEFAAGIPGTAGGWMAMNAGIPEREVKDVVRELEVMSPTGKRTSHLQRAELHFTYRALRGLAPGSVIVSALLEIEISSRDRVGTAVNRHLARRAASQPLNVPSCGSVFKNPPGDHAGRLIEAAGLKGYRIGGAQISPIHANFIANTGGASATDIFALIEKARAAVFEASGRHLETEVRILGEAR